MTIKIGNLNLYDLEELSKKFNVTLLTLRAYIRKGKLKGQKMGTKWYVSESGLSDFFDQYWKPKRKS